MGVSLESGEVTSIVGEQVVVKSTANPPKIGSPVYSGKIKVGVVADIIGSVESPYIVVKPQANAKIQVGDILSS